MLAYDAVVVGTGFGGAVAACRLAHAGIDVAVLERGRRFAPGESPCHVTGPGGLLWERGEGLYDVRPLNDMLVVQAAGYGGVSLVYANVQMQPPAELLDGWPSPYSRPALDPYCDLVASMLDVTQVDPVPPDDRSPRKTRAMVDALGGLRGTEQTFLPNLAISFRGSSHSRTDSVLCSGMHPLRRVHHRLQRRSEEHARPQLPRPSRAERRGGRHQRGGHGPRRDRERLSSEVPRSDRRRLFPAGESSLGLPVHGRDQHDRAIFPLKAPRISRT